MRKGFGLIGNLIRLKGNEYYNFENGYVLKRADPEQLEAILSYAPKFGSVINFFEKYKFNNKFKEIPKEEWNYWVVESTDIPLDIDFYHALNLSDFNLSIIFEVLSQTGCTGSESQNIYNFMVENRFKYSIMEINCSELNQVDSIYSYLKNISNNFPHIYEAIKDFNSLSLIPKSSTFKIVCIFSIFEYLLVKIQKEDINDKISIQLINKLNFINEKLGLSKMNYNDYFKGPNPKFMTLIGKLYAFRCDIAHGNRISFDEELQILQMKDKAYEFLYVFLKRVLIYAINNPEAILNLKENNNEEYQQRLR